MPRRNRCEGWLPLNGRAIFGRDLELDLMRSVIDSTSEGGQTVVIEGAAGIGKSRLLQEVLTYAEDRGCTTLVGDSDELERDRPFRAIVRAFDLDPGSREPVRAELYRLISGEPLAYSADTPEGAPSVSHQIVENSIDLIEQLSSASPVVLALEDLHWADPSTLRFLRHLARRVTQFRVAVFATIRPSPTGPDLTSAVHDLLSHGQHLKLQPLEAEAVTSLAEDVVSARLGSRLRKQVAGAGGSPLFVIEILESLQREDAIKLSAGVAEVGEISVPPSLRLTILRRLSFLSDQTLELLKIASVLGSSFSLGDLGVVTERSTFELLSSLSEAFRNEVLTSEEDRLAFRHDLVWEAIYSEIPMPIRRELHREAGRLMGEAGSSVIQVAQQISRGALAGDSEAIRLLHEAARETRARSASTTAKLLEQALELVDRADPQRPALLKELMTPLISLGRLDEAEALVRDQLAAAPEEDTDLTRVLATVTFFRGDRGRSRELFESCAQAPSTTDAERSTDLGLASIAAIYSGDLSGARTLAEKGRELGNRSGNPYGESISINTLGTIARFQDYAKEAVDLASKAVRLREKYEGDWDEFVVRPAVSLGASCLEADQLEEAETALRAGLAAERSLTWDTPWYQMYLGAKLFMSGNWDDAIAETKAGLSFLEDLEFTPFAAAIFPLGLIAVISLQRGDQVAGKAALAQADQELAQSGPQVGIDTMLWAKSMLLEAEGDASGARSVLELAWSLYSVMGYHFGHRWIGPDLVRLSMEAGKRDQATSVVEVLEELASRARAPTAEGVALRCRGLVEADAETLIAAVEAYRKGPRPFDTALACEDAAIALGRNVKTEEARSLFDEALGVYENVGADRAIRRAEGALRKVGIRRGRKGRRDRAVSGWESLTPTELKIVELVSQGKTNRAIGEELYISPRTVETHIGHVFAKLQTKTRTELVAKALGRFG